MTQKQIDTLKYLILVSKLEKVTELTKKLFWFIVDASENLTKNVGIVMIEGSSGFHLSDVSECMYGCNAMHSIGGNINEFFLLAESPFNLTSYAENVNFSNQEDVSRLFNSFSGVVDTDALDLPWSGKQLCFCLRLADKDSTDPVELIPLSLEILRKIELKAPKLYM